jgi:hypothetical protein
MQIRSDRYPDSHLPWYGSVKSDNSVIFLIPLFIFAKDCPYEYNITSLSLPCLSPYATEIRQLFENVRIVSEYMEDQN